MFTDAKIGDKVFDYTLQEWGEVLDINYIYTYPMEVAYKDFSRWYTLSGKQNPNDKFQILFWD